MPRKAVFYSIEGASIRKKQCIPAYNQIRSTLLRHHPQKVTPLV